MLGEPLEHAEITAKGVLGDRAYALLDKSTGRIITAKQPRKWARLFQCSAAFAESPRSEAPLPPVHITLPGGSVIHSGRDNVDGLLSAFLEHEVQLVRTPPADPAIEYLDVATGTETIAEFTPAAASGPGTFFDYAAIHIVTTASLDRMSEAYPAGQVQLSRFRPNLVLETSAPFGENSWVGRKMRMADSVNLLILDPCPRCVMITLPQRELPAAPRMLRVVGEENQPFVGFTGAAMPSFGLYASVVTGGAVRRGDVGVLA